MGYILGVDGGGTKTTMQIRDSQYNLLSEVEVGASNYKSVGLKVAIDNIVKGVKKAIDKTGKKNAHFYFDCACFGLSGYDSEKDRKTYQKFILDSEIGKYLNKNRLFIFNDTRIGLAAATNKKNGIIIICGTGSNCYGINDKGKEVKVGGWDYILGDEGSGYEIGAQALRAFMKAYDGRGEKTLLSRTILEDAGLKDALELVDWVYENPFFKEKISQLAKTVCRTANLGDKISKDILKSQVKGVELMVNVAVNKLGLEKHYFDLVFVGKVFECKKYFRAPLIEQLTNDYKKINILPLTRKPVEGAVKLAYRL